MAFSVKSVNRAWLRQGATTYEGARCAGCHKELKAWIQDMEVEGGWHAHHMIPKAYGRNDRFTNCVLLCITPPNCHLERGHGGSYHLHPKTTRYDYKYFGKY